MPPIYGDSFGGLAATLAQQEAARQRALEIGMATLMRGLEMANRDNQWDRSFALSRDRMASDDAYRDKVFNENVRQFDRTLDAPRRITMSELQRVADQAIALPPDHRSQFYKSIGLDDAQAGAVEAQVGPAQAEIQAEHVAQAEAADLINTEPRRRALMQEQRQIAGAYPSRRGSILTELAGRLFGYGGGLGRSMPSPQEDIERGVAAQEAALAARLNRTAPMKQDLMYNARTDTWGPSTAPAPGMSRWTRRVPERALLPGASTMPPSPQSAGTNAPSTQIANPQATGRYVPGRRYGDLRYLGGDPFDESSWAPVGASPAPVATSPSLLQRPSLPFRPPFQTPSGMY